MHIEIIMALHGDAAFLPDQLRSLAQQTHGDWSLTVVDDRAQTAALDQVNTFQNTRLIKSAGPGYAAAFATGLVQARGPYVAFCDQDDIWDRDKLERALVMMHGDTPMLYCASVRIGSRIYPSKPPTPSFQNALIENIARGNTVVFNAAAVKLLQATMPHMKAALAHDWWCYQVITGAGGQVIFDPKPALEYRQHAQNTVGEAPQWRSVITKAYNLISGRYAQKLERQLTALWSVRNLFTRENRVLFEAVLENALQAQNFEGLHRQTPLAEIGFRAGVKLGAI